MAVTSNSAATPVASGLSWRLRIALVLLTLVASAVVWTTNQLMTQRITETTQNRVDLRLTLLSGNLMSELQRSSIIPQVLSLDPALIGDLNAGEFVQSSQRLISYAEEINSGHLILMDESGRVVASSDRNRIGESRRNSGVFVEAIRASETVFLVITAEGGGTNFFYSRKIESAGRWVGVIAVEVDLRRFERSWAGLSDAVFVTDGSGNIILSTESRR